MRWSRETKDKDGKSNGTFGSIRRLTAAVNPKFRAEGTLTNRIAEYLRYKEISGTQTLFFGKLLIGIYPRRHGA
jgi:hypothetical protein